jgi:LuxR family maltose regulon positive regulatory protein
MLEAHPGLCLWAAWAALLAGEVERIEPALERARRAFLAAGQLGRLGEAAHLEAHLARLRHDGARAVAAASQALASLPDEARTQRAGSLLALGAGRLLAGELVAAAATLEEAQDRCREHNFLGMLVALRCLGDLAVQRGQLHVADKRYREVLGALGERDIWERQEAEIGLGDLARERNELVQAEELLRAALLAAERAGVGVYLPAGYVALARALAAGGDHGAAETVLDRALHAARRLKSTTYEHQIGAFRARLALARDDLVAARCWYAARAAEASGMGEVEALTYARLMIAEYRRAPAGASLSAARALLRRWRRNAEAQGRVTSLIEILALTALVEAARGRSDLALPAIHDALALAAPEGYARIFLDEGGPMRALLTALRARLAAQARNALGQAPEHIAAYIDDLLAAMRPQADATPAAGGCPEEPTEMLSGREIEVLSLIAGGASNQTIAEALVISIGTVKSHINHILGKLASRSRTEAVARARERGLLPS